VVWNGAPVGPYVPGYAYPVGHPYYHGNAYYNGAPVGPYNPTIVYAPGHPYYNHGAYFHHEMHAGHAGYPYHGYRH